MAPLSTGTAILIYAELLSNIRQVSIAVNLPTPSDSSTRAEIQDNGRFIYVHHQGCSQTLGLPAQVAVSSSLPVPGQAAVDLTWRLTVSPTDATVSRSSAEQQPVPWDSTDLAVGSEVSCRKCGLNFIPQGKLTAWLDLPSENWAEMMEFWHCHKPHDHHHGDDIETLASKGYGASNVISARSNTGLVDIASLMFSESDCQGLKVSCVTLFLISAML